MILFLKLYAKSDLNIFLNLVIESPSVILFKVNVNYSIRLYIKKIQI